MSARAVGGNREHDVDRLRLREQDDPVVSEVHHVPTSTCRRPPAGEGRGDVGPVELQARVRDRATIGLHGARVLADQCSLVVDLLLGDRILRQQRLVAVEVAARAREQRLVGARVVLRPARTPRRRPRVDFGEQRRRSSPRALPGS